MRPWIAAALRATGALAAAAVLAGGGWYGYEAAASRPIAAVRFTGDTARVGAVELERLASGIRGRVWREVSLADVREAARRLPWVRESSVRRVFPATIEIAVEAHEALARWDDTHLVSVRGEVFAAETAEALPRFSGPEGAAAEMAAAWPRIDRAAAGLGSPVTELRLSERRAWQARLASGLAIELGRGDVEARLARFAAAWPQVAAEAGDATHADLRYPNGFALRGGAAQERRNAPKGRRA